MFRRPRGSRQRLGSSCLALVLVLFACAEPPPESDVVDAEGGLVQPSGDGATFLDASAACERLRAALTGRADELGGCEVALDCPAGILPAGGCDAWEYDASTLDACEAEIADYESCADFTERSCVVTAVPTGAVCVEPSGGGGEAGAGSTGAAGATGD